MILMSTSEEQLLPPDEYNCIGKVIISTSHELETGITRIKSRTVTDIKHNLLQ